MVLVIGKGSIEEKIKHEKETRRMIRKQEDLTGSNKSLYRSKGPQRGDYKFCDESSKYLSAMRKHPKEQDKISREYHDWQKSQRKYG